MQNWWSSSGSKISWAIMTLIGDYHQRLHCRVIRHRVNHRLPFWNMQQFQHHQLIDCQLKWESQNRIIQHKRTHPNLLFVLNCLCIQSLEMLLQCIIWRGLIMRRNDLYPNFQTTTGIVLQAWAKNLPNVTECWGISGLIELQGPRCTYLLIKIWPGITECSEPKLRVFIDCICNLLHRLTYK